MTKKVILTAVVAILLSLVLAAAWAPFLVKSWVEKTYPGIRIEGVNLHWGYATLINVRVNRGHVQGTLDRVDITLDKEVEVQGGSLEVNLDEGLRKVTGAKVTPEIRGSGLHVHVKRRSSEALFDDVRFDPQRICFSQGTVHNEGYQATIYEGCFLREERQVEAKQVDIPVILPLELPKMAKEQTLHFKGVTATPDAWEMSFEEVQMPPFFKTKAKSSLVYNGKLLLSLNDLEVSHPWVSPTPVTFKHVTVGVSKDLKVGLGLGPVMLSVEPSRFYISGDASCNDWIEAMPTPLPNGLAEAAGHFKGDLRFEVTKEPSPKLELHHNCSFECSAEPIASLISALRKNGPPIVYKAYDKDNKLFDRKIGPLTRDWVNFDSLHPYTPRAFITMEDPGFLSHRGIVVQALENSFKDNLKLGKFFRGGSTISMQLAKNLWLRRYKTLDRKSQEILLTIALESCLSKAEILGLYLNVVEFGPDLYGIGPASHHYFAKGAEGLEPVESFYLASILPRPRKAIPPSQGGLDRTQSLMRVLAQQGFISDVLVPVRDEDVAGLDWDAE